MIGLFLFIIFYLNIIFSCENLSYDDEKIFNHKRSHTSQEILATNRQNFLIFIHSSEITKKTDIIFIDPKIFKNLSIFMMRSDPFEIPIKSLCNPRIYETLRQRNPSCSLVKDNFLQQKFQEIFAIHNKHVLKNINALANNLLSTLNQPNNFYVHFNHAYQCDQDFLRDTLRSFFGIIHREEVESSKEQIFIMAFSQIWKALKADNSNIILNISLHKHIGEIIGFGCNYREDFQQAYPALTKWLENNTINNKKSLSTSYFSLCFMYALTAKIHLPIKPQIHTNHDSPLMRETLFRWDSPTAIQPTTKEEEKSRQINIPQNQSSPTYQIGSHNELKAPTATRKNMILRKLLKEITPLAQQIPNSPLTSSSCFGPYFNTGRLNT